jgi:hypothetical protein
MKCILVVGKKKTGKTTWVKNALTKLDFDKFIFDPNGHYEGQFMGDNIDDFLKIAYTKRNSVIVVEEATIFFKSAKKQEQLQSLLVRSRHQNNFVFLCFHSLRSVPTWCLDLCDAMRLSKTNDTLQVLNKFDGLDKIETAFKSVNYFSPSNPYASYFIDFYKE